MPFPMRRTSKLGYRSRSTSSRSPLASAMGVGFRVLTSERLGPLLETSPRKVALPVNRGRYFRIVDAMPPSRGSLGEAHWPSLRLRENRVGMLSRSVLVVAVALLASASPARGLCFGDLNDDGRVTVDELLVLVDRALDPAKNPTPRPTQFTPTRVPTRSVRPTRTPIPPPTLAGNVVPDRRRRRHARTSRTTPADSQTTAAYSTGTSEPHGVGRVTGLNGLIVGIHNAVYGCPPLRCQPGSVYDSWPHFEVKETVVGTNGTFTDECAEGSLMEWRCGLERDCSTPYNPRPSECTTFETGLVVSRTFACHGGCVDGACLRRCPTTSDYLVYIELGKASVTFENETDGRQYDCVLTNDSDDDFDCALDPIVGDRERVSSFQPSGTLSRHCFEDEFGFPTLENGCRYRCGIKEDSDLNALGG